MRVRTVVFVLVAVVVLIGASALSMYPSLSDARDAVDEQWTALEPTLDARYDALGTVSRAVRAEQADLELLDEVDDAVARWKTLAARRDADTEEATRAANRCESASALLGRAITARPSLSSSQDVVLALGAYLATDPRGATQTFNNAVEKYDRARNRFPGPFFASSIGFESMATVEVPPALNQIELPDPSPGPAPDAPASPEPTPTPVPS